MIFGGAGVQIAAPARAQNGGSKPGLGRVGEYLSAPIQSGENGCQRRLHDIVAASDTAGALAIDIELYVTHCLRVGTLAQRVLRVLNHYDMRPVNVSMACTKASTTPLPWPVNVTSP